MSGTAAALRVAYCAWCRYLAQATQPIRFVETAIGPGGMLRACPKCCTSYGLIPLANLDAFTKHDAAQTTSQYAPTMTHRRTT